MGPGLSEKKELENRPRIIHLLIFWGSSVHFVCIKKADVIKSC